MAPKKDFTEILIRQGVLSPEQIAEAKKLAKASGAKLPDSILKLGYASGEEVMRAMAQEHGLDYIDLREMKSPPPSWNWCPSRSPARTRSCRWPRRTGPCG